MTSNNPSDRAISSETRAVTTRRPRIATHPETFDEVARADLGSDAVEVTRVPLNQTVVGTRPGIRTEGDLTVVPVFEEVLVIERQLILKEEIHIRKRTRVETVDVPVTLRRQVAEVDRSGD